MKFLNFVMCCMLLLPALSKAEANGSESLKIKYERLDPGWAWTKKLIWCRVSKLGILFRLPA